MEVLPEVTNLPAIPTPLETIENMLLGVEARMIETIEDKQKSREDRMLMAIERLEARVEELSLPWWKKVWKIKKAPGSQGTPGDDQPYMDT